MAKSKITVLLFINNLLKKKISVDTPTDAMFKGQNWQKRGRKSELNYTFDIEV